MTDETLKPLPGVIISNSDENETPITSFDLVIIVEPDPESYMPLPGDINKLNEYIMGLYKNYDNEFNPDNPLNIKEPVVVWLRYYSEEVNYFDEFANVSLARVIFNIFDSEDLEQFNFYLQGFVKSFPEGKAALIGGMFEDEVIYVANFILNFGLDVTILSRYCLSNRAFFDLENALTYDQWVRNTGRKDGEKYKSWLDDWFEENGTEIDFNNDDEEETDTE